MDCDMGRKGGQIGQRGITTVVTPVAAKEKTGMEAWLSSDDGIDAYGTVMGWPIRRRA